MVSLPAKAEVTSTELFQTISERLSSMTVATMVNFSKPSGPSLVKLLRLAYTTSNSVQ